MSVASSARLTTPPPAQLIDPIVHSTPISLGSNTNATYHTYTRQRDYAAYIHQDLKHEKPVSFADFCSLVLDFDPHHALRTFNGKVTNQLERLRNDYCEPVSEETERYKPFFDYANCILQNSSSEYVLCRNDPVHLWGIYASRKPDEILTSQAALTGDFNRLLVDNLSVGGPSQSPFHPVQVVSFFEFKLKEHNLTDRNARFPKATSYPPHNTRAPLMSNVVTDAQPTPSGSGPTSQKRKASEHLSNEGTVPVRRKSPRLNSDSGYVPRLMNPPLIEVPVTVTGDDDPPEHTLLQCASYALEMMSQGLRQHVIAFLVTDAQIEFLYYDRSILLRSAPLNFIDDWELFEATLAHMGSMPLSKWGFHPLLPAAELTTLCGRLSKPFGFAHAPVVNLFEGVIIELNNGCRLKLGDIIHQTHGLRGRGTLVIRARPLPGAHDLPEEVVVKISWPSSSRTAESTILATISEAIDRTGETWVRDHLPTCLHFEVIEDLVDIQSRLAAHFGNDYEQRTLSVYVFEALQSISELKEETILGKAFLDTVKCHKWVFETAGVLHRDISLRNLMYRKNAEGVICGVLNDFDLATLASQLNNGATSTQRTGTRPYMALDLLRTDPPPPHLYRHDLESFFYVFCHLVCDPSEAQIGWWSTFSNHQLAQQKRAIVTTPTRQLLSPDYPGMADCLEELQDLFVGVFRWKPVPGVVDDGTLGRLITSDVFVNILTKLPSATA